MKVFGLHVNYLICSLDFRYTEAAVRRCSLEQVLLKISQCWNLFLIKLRAFRHVILLKGDFNTSTFAKFAKSLRASFLQNTSGGCFWKYLMNSLFIAYGDDESCHCVVSIGSPALISFYCVCFVSFLFFYWFYSLLRYWGKFVNT